MNGLQRVSSRLLLLHNKPAAFTPSKNQPGRVATLLVVLGTALAMTATAAEKYPTRTIRFVVPAAIGGQADISSRLLAAELSKQMGQQIAVDNRAGASGIIGTDTLVKAPSDGYTIAQGNTITLATNRFLYSKLPYDADKDLQLVALVSTASNVLVVAPKLPVKSVKELVEYARKNPGKLSFGSSGNGSSTHLGGELLKMLTGTQMVHVPYKGSQQALTDTIGGQIQFMVENTASVLPHVKAGRLRALGVTSLKRSTVIPELPTISEAGVPGYEIVTFGGVIVRTGVPKAIVTKLNAEINKALKSPELKAKHMELGYEISSGTPEQFDAFVKKQAAKWGDLIKRTGAKLD